MQLCRPILFLASILAVASASAIPETDLFGLAPQTLQNTFDDKFKCTCEENNAGKKCYEGGNEKVISGGTSSHYYKCYKDGKCKDLGKKDKCKGKDA